VALQLKRHGITRVHPLKGGFAGWMALGFPVEDRRPVEPTALTPVDLAVAEAKAHSDQTVPEARSERFAGDRSEPDGPR
jgi:3-mercaptopyruvate sulfurtransferase SseA